MNTTTTITTNRRIDVKAVLAAALLTAGTLVPAATVGAGPVEEVEQRCLAEASGSADSLQRWADHCRDAAGEYRTAYHACMLDAPGSADSLERWVDHCAASARAADDG